MFLQICPSCLFGSPVNQAIGVLHDVDVTVLIGFFNLVQVKVRQTDGPNFARLFHFLQSLDSQTLIS